MRQHGIPLKRDDGGTHSRLLVESRILLTASRSNPAAALKDAAAAYMVNTDAIALKVKHEFAAKQKSKTAHRQHLSQRREPARNMGLPLSGSASRQPLFSCARLPAVAWLLL